ncbi:hypothetical protein [Teichococcus vastitatis]|uniref:Uncharacterized protein n=1 Tax=Teichococcus vastitatis TaxID=2307076 RepID=A0ABS9W7B0_9PROT|nr:hypothetical protein [Pseudoroseomonas vastitatis]MCI0754913.1 hypothetical protein [Pseudoroseomonas vastitatis]
MAFSKRGLEKRSVQQEERQAGFQQSAAEDIRVLAVSNAVGRIDTTDQVVEAISQLWREAQGKFLAIGRYLVRAKEEFPKAFDKEVVSRLPFSYATAHQLMSVARAVDRGVLKLDELPRTYSVAYQLVTLDRDALAEARHGGLVSPDVSRKAILDFKRTLEERKLAAQGRKAALEREKEELATKASRLKQQLAEAMARLAEIDADLAGGRAAIDDEAAKARL